MTYTRPSPTNPHPGSTGPFTALAGYKPPPEVYYGRPAGTPQPTTDGATAAGAPPLATGVAALSGDQRNAYNAVLGIFSTYGLQSLAPEILKFVQQGYDQATTSYLLQQTDAYKQRFAGNDARVKNGLAPLSPAEYLATERAYKDTAQAYGLPKDFYDNPSDFAGLIGKDISPSEFQQRASYAFKYAQASNPEARAALKQYYGVDDSHLASYFLDPDKAQAVLDRQVAAVDIGADAGRQGLNVDRSQAEKYVDQGVTNAQAQGGFANAADIIDKGQLDIANRFNSDLTSQDIEDETVTGLASAARKRALLNQNEQALFLGNTAGALKSGAGDSFGSY